MELVITLFSDRVLEIQCLLLSGLLLAFRTGITSIFILVVSLVPTKCLLQSRQVIDIYISHYISGVSLFCKYLVQSFKLLIHVPPLPSIMLHVGGGLWDYK